ncbi:uncharacterized protein BX664DRAFT_288278 [Halteromyces radiatus]|uniref:uncharacterized protein n=1 Tax=Halteromyces radiatus TaxID=101107 RepID=UPI00221FE3DE|nr:uncharacterized protein BX664DRAFT_288278 [Halteromyces radiatus]KAI8098667.1 hypothetical protein BX664DRAFT_288278 [Halteromyces radiatus]
MGKLQDNQYNAFGKNKKQTKTDLNKEKDLLYQQFCPPLDSSLIEAIWLDTYDYAQSLNILRELAKEADASLNAAELEVQSNMDNFEDQLDLMTIHETDSNNNNKTLSSQISNSTTHLSTPSGTTSIDSSSYDTSSQDTMDDDLDFLARCFPNMDLQQLKNVLLSQGSDVERATDVLLNNAYFESDDYSNSTRQEDNDDILYHGIQKKKKPGRRGNNKENKKGKQTLWTSRYMEPLHNNNKNDDGPTTIPFNYWHQYDDTIGKICQVFPSLSRSNIHGCVQRCKGNTIASVVMLMTKIPQAQPVLHWQLATNLDQVEQGMAVILVDRTAEQIRRIAIGVVIQYQNDHDVNQMVQQGIEFALTYEKQQQDLASRMAKLSQTPSTTTTTTIGDDMPVIPEYLLMTNQQTYTEDDPELCRAMAMDLILTRNELFQKASAAYRAGKNKKTGEQGVAFFYSDEARQLDTKAREWNMRAARAYVRNKRLKQNDDHLLDLHGLTVNEAQTLVKEGLTQWWSRSQIQMARRKIQPLQIVTGTGTHSEYGQARLLPSIQKLLRTEGWLFDSPHPGCFLVKGVVSKVTS